MARKLAEAYPVELVNSVNPARIEGQKTAAFEVVDALGDAPDIHVLPVGNAGNITAYWRGYTRVRLCDAGLGGEVLAPVATQLPQMWGFQAAGAAPIVARPPRRRPRDHRHRDPHRQPRLLAAGRGRPRRVGRPHRGGDRRGDPRGPPLAVLHRGDLRRARLGGRASPACSRPHRGGSGAADATVVCTVTGHGLKDPQWALRTADGSEVTPVRVPVDAFASRPRSASRGDVSGDALRVGAAVEVRVPASSANLGPGFDSVGCALGVWDTAGATVAERRASSSRSRARAPATCRSTRPTSCTAPCRSPGASSASSRRRACSSSAATGCRTAGAWGRRRPRSSPASSPHRRCTTSPAGATAPTSTSAFAATPRLAPRGSPRQRHRERARRGHPVVVGRRAGDDPHGAPGRAPRRRAGRLRARRAAVDRQGPVGAAAAGAPRRRRRRTRPAPRCSRTRSPAPRSTCSRPPATGCTRRRGAPSYAGVDGPRRRAARRGSRGRHLGCGPVRPRADAARRAGEVAAHGGPRMAGAAPRHPGHGAGRGQAGLLDRAGDPGASFGRLRRRRGATLDPATAADAGAVPLPAASRPPRPGQRPACSAACPAWLPMIGRIEAIHERGEGSFVTDTTTLEASATSGSSPRRSGALDRDAAGRAPGPGLEHGHQRHGQDAQGRPRRRHQGAPERRERPGQRRRAAPATRREPDDRPRGRAPSAPARPRGDGAARTRTEQRRRPARSAPTAPRPHREPRSDRQRAAASGTAASASATVSDRGEGSRAAQRPPATAASAPQRLTARTATRRSATRRTATRQTSGDQQGQDGPQQRQGGSSAAPRASTTTRTAAAAAAAATAGATATSAARRASGGRAGRADASSRSPRTTSSCPWPASSTSSTTTPSCAPPATCPGSSDVYVPLQMVKQPRPAQGRRRHRLDQGDPRGRGAAAADVGGRNNREVQRRWRGSTRSTA